ncbi:hypothetical protein AgCh_039917 [Apium graveolens]
MENSGSGHGVVIRDYRGKVMAAKTSFSYLSFSPFAAEILAIKGDLRVVQECWLSSIKHGKKIVREDAPVPWSETNRGKEWIKEWNKVDFVPTSNILAKHLDKDDEMLVNDDFKAQLRVTALSTRNLQGQHSITQTKVNKIQETLIQKDINFILDKNRFFKPAFNKVEAIEKAQEKQQAQIAEVLKNQASQQIQLKEFQSSVELLLSLLLPDDAKKGEKVVKSKCSTDLALKKKDDGNDDQGNSEKGRGHGQGKGSSSGKAGTSTQRSSSDADRRISSDKQVLTKPDVLIQGESQESQKFIQTLKLKGKETTVYYQDPKIQKLDEEISKRLFLKDNPGMDFESMKEEESRLKAENVKSKSKASISAKKPPKPKGIVIKEKTNFEATKFESKVKSQVEVDPRFKGKAKVDDSVKIYLPIMDLEVKSDEDTSLILKKKKNIQTTSDKAHVVQDQDILYSDMTMKQATSDRAQVGLISEDKGKKTSDIAHVKPSKILLPGFTKAQQSAQPMKTLTNVFKGRLLQGKKARDKKGQGNADERRVNNSTLDPTSLSEPGVGSTPERLNQLESVQMVYHSVLKEDIMLYFMTDVRVFQIRKDAIRLKYFVELQHVIFLLQVKNRSTDGAVSYLKSNIQRQKKLYSVKSDRPYYPKYRAHNGELVEMKHNTAKITTFLGIKGLEFNLESDKAYLIRLDQEIRKEKINDLRAAIFQTGEDTAELKDEKRRMQNELEYAERSLLKNYLRTTPDIREITH